MNRIIKQEVAALMMRIAVLALFVLGILTPAPSMANAAGMDMRSVAEKEVRKVGPEGKEYFEYVTADSEGIVPGDIIRFTNIYRNIGKDTAEPGLAIKNPVPKDVSYIGGTAAGKNAKITFSVDGGKSFGNPSELFVPGEDGRKRLARPEEYTDIKWVILKAVVPGEEGSVTYKGKLK